MTSPSQAGAATFELKASSFTLPTLHLLSGDLERLGDQLAAKVRQAPDFFRNTPVVIDLSRIPELAVDFPMLVGLMRSLQVLPVGVRGGTQAQHDSAVLMELAVLGEARPVRREEKVPAQEKDAESAPPTAPESRGEAPEEAVPPPESDSQPVAAASAEPVSPPEQTARPAAGPEHPHTRLVTRPVRSGQKIYAPGGDLIVAAPVSAGAELMADGNIHVYGPMRGKALAGVKGDEKARVFCRVFGAELVSIAGRYRLYEQIEKRVVGAAVQIYLSQDKLIIEPL